mmetsp:Transcript_45013/g.51042  ORF Transcript_45013/g.51042 Transcript_45013/m.51042 type:complete len:99 (+) Transcript_45013:543-839(+)
MTTVATIASTPVPAPAIAPPAPADDIIQSDPTFNILVIVDLISITTVIAIAIAIASAPVPVSTPAAAFVVIDVTGSILLRIISSSRIIPRTAGSCFTF